MNKPTKNDINIKVADLPGEKWAIIEDAPLYMVSNYQRVKSTVRMINTKRGVRQGYEKLIKQRVNGQTRYYEVGLYIDTSKQKYMSVHRIFAKAFIPNPLNLPLINHIDTNKLNNKINNLEWCTNVHNSQHASKNGCLNGLKGEKSPVSKLKNDQVIDIFLSKLKHTDLAKKYNIHPVTVFNIRNQQSWKSLTDTLKIKPLT